MYACEVLDVAEGCTQWVAIPPATLLPPLSLEDAGLILASVAMVLAVAWGWRVLQRLL